MGKYDHIMTKQGDIQYKIMMADIALANEKSEENRLHRIKLALKISNLTTEDRRAIESLVEEDLDLTDQA